MCDHVIPSGDDGAASVLVLCKGDRVGHILAWRNVRAGLGSARAALSAILTAASTVVAEGYYFDLDFRSEGALQANQFGFVEPTVDRLHFFSTSFVTGQSVREFLLATRQQDHEAEAERNGRASVSPPAYLGYLTFRPGRDVRIGRSLISPWADAESTARGALFTKKKITLAKEVVHRQVRTAVAENVNILGIDFRGVGVPFMEQDGALLRCAHVSAWICHYAAVLRGLSARRTTSQFHLAGNTVNSLARPYPSSGLSMGELANILRSANLPPEVLTYNDLRRSRKPTWADRQSLRNADAVTKLRASRDRLWIEENLCATVCRYLNSGIPVILARNGMGHTQVVVGYLRDSDIEPASGEADNGHSDVVAFLVSDDQDGPFVVVRVSDLVAEVLQYSGATGDTQIVVPLPSGLWVAGDQAEARGAALLLRAATSRRDRMAKTSPDTDEYARLDAFVKRLGAGHFTIRTYASTGVDVKRSAERRLEADPGMVRAIAQTQMPRHVWVCEVIDRVERTKSDMPSVVATLVLDATALLGDVGVDSADAEIVPLFLHVASQFYSAPYGFPDVERDDLPLPDIVVRITDGVKKKGDKEEPSPVKTQILPPPQDKDALEQYIELDGAVIPLDEIGDAEDWWWNDTSIGLYFTGRWSHERISAMTASHVAGYSKAADSAD